MATHEIAVSMEIDAPIETVWALVSDLEAMGRRSPQCKAMKVLGGGPEKGTWTLNLNRKGLLWWPTWSIVTEFQPRSLLEFRIPLNTSRWRFELSEVENAPTEGSSGSIPGAQGTRLTHRRLVEGNTTLLSRGLVGLALGGEKDFEADLRRGMQQTIETIAREAERG